MKKRVTIFRRSLCALLVTAMVMGAPADVALAVKGNVPNEERLDAEITLPMEDSTETESDAETDSMIEAEPVTETESAPEERSQPENETRTEAESETETESAPEERSQTELQSHTVISKRQSLSLSIPIIQRQLRQKPSISVERYTPGCQSRRT